MGIKRITVVFLVLLGIIGIVSIRQVDGSSLADNNSDEALVKPVHTYAYKLGDVREVKKTVQNNDRIAENRIAKIKSEQAAEAEKTAQEEAEKKATEAKEKDNESKEVTELNVAEEKTASKAVQPTESTSSQKTSSSTNQQSSKKEAASKPAPAPKPASAPKKASTPAPAPKPKSAPKAEPKKPAIGSNKIGINGTYKSYSNYGRANTDKLQSSIDSGLIVAGLNNFNGTDGATTYFGGHNPGVMNFMASSIRIGGVITVTDSNGNAFNYKMIDKVDVDEYGEGVLKSIGVSAIDAYMYGTGAESILIQFCNTNNNLMSFWYGVKI